jgi:hypothetical protein
MQRLKRHGPPILYLDEASFNCWQYQRKTFFRNDLKLEIPLAKKRDSGFTLIGCIGKPLHNMGYF